MPSTLNPLPRQNEVTTGQPLAAPKPGEGGSTPPQPGPRSLVHSLWSLVLGPRSFLRGPWSVVLPLALFAVLWLDLIRLLSTQWEAREQYAYGWFVPLFAAALLWRRWLDRPGAGLPDHGTAGQQVSSQSTLRSSASEDGWSVVSSPPFLLSAFCFLLCLLLLPLRVIYEINTDWPLISWVYTLIVVALTLYAFQLAGPPPVSSPNFSFQLSASQRFPAASSPVSGQQSQFQLSAFSISAFLDRPRSLLSPWLRHFAFPVCFILVAVVWPYRLEKGLTQGLMRVVASITVELLGWLDIPALQRGNLIDLATGTVGVDEACSGIRSFQSSLMAALLLGELYRFRLWPRAALVATGLGLGFCFNVVRTLILSYQANAHGLEALEKWHDPAGMTITVACFFCLWGLALLIRKAESRKQKAEIQVPGLIPQPSPSSPLTSDLRPLTSGSPDSQPSTFNSQPPSAAAPRPSGPFCFLLSAFCSSPCRRYLVAVGIWSLLSIAATEAWYRSHTPKDSGVFHWTVALPEGKAGFEKIQLAPRTIELLKYDQAVTGKWRVDDGSEWSVNFFRWQPRSIESVITSRVHRPERCLPASGFRQISDSEPIEVEAGGLKLPFRKYTYEMEGRKLYVFFCQWEDGAEKQLGMQSSGQEDRLQSVLKGRRLVGQQTLEIIVSGGSSLDEAERLLRKQLPGLIRLETPVRTAQANP